MIGTLDGMVNAAIKAQVTVIAHANIDGLPL